MILRGSEEENRKFEGGKGRGEMVLLYFSLKKYQEFFVFTHS